MKLTCGHFTLDLARPLVMGIVNVTPDSFFDGGQHVVRDRALAHAQRLIDEGADILDIGGESTRPGAQPVSAQQELDRVMPVIEGLRGAPVPVSIDTCKPEVMQSAIAMGVQMVNDISALEDEAAMYTIARQNVAVCLMHKQGKPQTMQTHPEYQNVLDEVRRFLYERIVAAKNAGVQQNRIVIDPGFGFGKTLAHNLELLRQLDTLSDLDVPILVGLSRKSMLGTLTGKDVAQRQSASVAAALIAVQHGADIVRVHDVAETVDALKIWNAVNGESGE
ncbi:MAG TPA: dihydropteroate synthase [Gallionella sp.]|nr:dihydropteroate synthase [Gallionella sp.]